MNYLLYRSQWGAHSRLGSEIPPEVVWEKILTAPDTSSLNVYDHDKRIGICHWIANVGNSPIASNKIIENDYAPDGADEQVTGYSLTFEGNAALSSTNRLGFEINVNLSTNRDWKDFHLRVSIRPDIWDVQAVAATEKVTLRVDDNHTHYTKNLTFSDLRNPELLLADIGGPAAWAVLAGAGITPSTESVSKMAGTVQWQAHEDWINFGHTRARAYRIETALLGKHVRIFTSRVGEILWVELPNGITLRNEAFEHI